MRVGPTLATGKQGWEMLIGRMAAGFPSQSPRKQNKKVAKPPVKVETLWNSNYTLKSN